MGKQFWLTLYSINIGYREKNKSGGESLPKYESIYPEFDEKETQIDTSESSEDEEDAANTSAIVD